MTYEVTIDDKNYRVEVACEDGRWNCALGGRALQVDAVLVRPNVLSLLIDGISYEVRRETNASETQLWIGGTRYRTELRDPRSLQSRRGVGGGPEGTKKIVAPMPGKVVRVLVKEGMEVQAAQGVIVVEAMKMQNELKSPKQGTVRKVMGSQGTSVNAGDVLLTIE